jgi:hypothetical protein
MQLEIQMNVARVQHIHVQNQQQSSWIDDPFQIGTHAFRELKPMSHEINLSNYAEELVTNYAKYEDGQYSLFLSDLSEYDQNELSRLYIEFSGRELTECVNGKDFSVDNEYTCALLSMLQDDSHENRERFAEVTRQNIINFYSESLQEILDKSCHNYLHSINNEQGLFANQDRDSGEIHWGKF